MKTLKKYLSKKYSDDYGEFPNGYRIYDVEVAKFMLKHFKIWDWLNPYKVASGALHAFTCLQEGEDSEKTWKERFD